MPVAIFFDSIRCALGTATERCQSHSSRSRSTLADSEIRVLGESASACRLSGPVLRYWQLLLNCNALRLSTYRNVSSAYLVLSSRGEADTIRLPLAGVSVFRRRQA